MINNNLVNKTENVLTNVITYQIIKTLITRGRLLEGGFVFIRYVVTKYLVPDFSEHFSFKFVNNIVKKRS